MRSTRSQKNRVLVYKLLSQLILIFVLTGPGAIAQGTGKATANGNCIVANTGSNALINQKCFVVDPELFKQFKSIADASRHNSDLLKAILDKLQPVLEFISSQQNPVRSEITQTMSDSPNSIQQLSTGPNSPNTVNVAPSLWTVDDQHGNKLRSLLSPAPTQHVFISPVSSENQPLTFKLVQILRASGWDAQLGAGSFLPGSPIVGLAVWLSPDASNDANGQKLVESLKAIDLPVPNGLERRRGLGIFA